MINNISDAEIQRRAYLIQESNASVELEGFVICEEFKTMQMRYIRGDINMNELGEELFVFLAKRPSQAN